MVPGIPGATGAGGPSLDGVARRVYLAGVLPNTTANLTLWIKAPQSVLKGNAMPDTNLSAEDAEAIVAYLQTLR